MPVGEDQAPMIELTREIVNRFNNIYGETLVEPEILLPSNAACLRLPGTDGKAKMSKSLGNCIYLSDTAKEVSKKIKSMYTDPLHLNVDDPDTLRAIVRSSISTHSVVTSTLRDICPNIRIWMN